MRARLTVIGICAVLVGMAWFVPAILNGLFNGMDMVFGWAGPFAVVTIVSAITGALFIMAFPHVSSQQGIVAVKDKIKVNLLGIRLFQDNIKNVLKSIAGMFTWNFVYLGLNILPMIVLAAPFMVVWFQLNALYAYEPLKAGQEQMVVVELADGVSPASVQVDIPEGIALKQKVNLPVSENNRILLRLTPEAEGSMPLVLTHNGEVVTKTIEVGTDPQRLARLRTSEPLARFAAAQDPIVKFADPPLPSDSFLKAVTVDYGPKPLWFMDGGEISIMIWFVVVSMAVGFGLKGAFGVVI